MRIEALRNPGKSVSPETLARWDLLIRLERHLLRNGNPKLQMFMLVATTGSVGLLTSTALIRLHLRIMTLRYPVSVLVAYGAFLALVWLWILWLRRRWNRITNGRGSPRADVLTREEISVEQYPDWIDWLDPDLFSIALVVAGAISVVFVIWHLVSAIAFAPEFIAEVLLDGVFGAALYRRLRRIEHRHWFKSVVATTRALFLWTLVFSAFIGAMSQRYAPEAISIGGVISHMVGRVR
jgi:hypothetical protein